MNVAIKKVNENLASGQRTTLPENCEELLSDLLPLTWNRRDFTFGSSKHSVEHLPQNSQTSFHSLPHLYGTPAKRWGFSRPKFSVVGLICLSN